MSRKVSEARAIHGSFDTTCSLSGLGGFQARFLRGVGDRCGTFLQSLREDSMGLGASIWRNLKKNLPCPGLVGGPFTGCISAARIFGDHVAGSAILESIESHFPALGLP